MKHGATQKKEYNHNVHQIFCCICNNFSLHETKEPTEIEKKLPSSSASAKTKLSCIYETNRKMEII
jgi:hypothetical protein